jgi:hypothetical protein
LASFTLSLGKASLHEIPPKGIGPPFAWSATDLILLANTLKKQIFCLTTILLYCTLILISDMVHRAAYQEVRCPAQQAHNIGK